MRNQYNRKNMRRLSILVTAQTLYNLQKLADMTGSRNVGRVVDKLTREKMLALKGLEVQKGAGD